jgi:hypothetical protein
VIDCVTFERDFNSVVADDDPMNCGSTLVLATRASWPEFQKPETSREACKLGFELSFRLVSARDARHVGQAR